MIETQRDVTSHDECWAALPWLANGRISAVERDRIEEHVHSCTACAQELALQRLLCKALAEPDRVTYAPGPSFRKLADRINRAQARSPRARMSTPQSRSRRKLRFVLRRPGAGVAWAASLVLAAGVAGFFITLYRWSEPLYATHTEEAHPTSAVLHIAFDRSLTIGEVEQILHGAGARVVEGPGATGLFGVSPVAVASGQVTGAGASREIQLLSARLRAEPRVRWVEPVSEAPRGP